MRTVRRLLYRDIVGAVGFVALAFLSLFYFIDLIDELDRLSRIGIGPVLAAGLSLMSVPAHFYELFPIAVLIGTILSLSRLAQSSEFTILRTGGLGPRRALTLLASLAAMFALITFVIGDFVAPRFEQGGQQIRARLTGDASFGRRGAWLKDHQVVQGEERSFSVNVDRVNAAGQLQQVRIYEFDAHGGLLSRTEAKTADVDTNGVWQLSDVRRSDWRAAAKAAPGTAATASGEALVTDTVLPRAQWASSLNAGVIAAAVLPAVSMSTVELYRYTEHLSAQEQSAQAHNIQFWRKAFYPFACFVMMALALPFAYLHGRAGGTSLKVFGGIMLGISFVLLSNVAGHIGVLKNWTPWVVAATPSLIYLALSLAAFGWLVRNR